MDAERPRIRTRFPGVYYRLRKDGTRQHIYEYTDSEGKQHFKNFPGGERECAKARAQMVSRIHRGEKVVPSRVTFAEFSRTWLEEQPGLAPNTVSTWRGMIENHLIPRLGRVRLADVDVNMVASLIAEMKDEGLKANTINTALAPLNKIMASAVRRGIIPVNPVSQLERSERPRGDQTRMNILDTDEIGMLLNNAGDYRLIFATAIFTGLRVSELCALRWEDIDWDNECIRVRGTKTKAARREVDLMPTLTQQLSHHSLERDEGFVFPNLKGDMLHRAVVSKAFRATLTKAGIGKRVRFHDLRHTFASILIEHGESDEYIAEQMGHTSGSFTRQRYGHLRDGDRKRREARERMEARFGGVLA